MIFIATLLLALFLATLLTPLAARLGQRLAIVDRPGGRRKHAGAIPRTGGLALVAAFTLTVIVVMLAPLLLPESWRLFFPQRNDPNELRRLFAFLGGGLFCAAAGFLDDRYEWESRPQFVAQFVAALIAVSGLIFIKHVNNPLTDDLFWGPDGLPWWLVLPITVAWFMGMMNTVNWLDGLSGLVAGVTVIFCAIVAIHMIFRATPPQLSVALLPLALMGTAAGFLPFNFAPARLFMGSSGSYFLGFAIATVGIIGGARLATVLLILGLPLLDVLWLVFDRRRRGLSPAHSGRDHLHFRLLDRGISERVIVLGYWAFCAIFGALTLVVDDRLYKLFALGGLVAVAIGVLRWAARHPSDNSQRES